MEETKWLTKGKIITFVVVILLIAGIVVGVMVHKNNLKNDYVKFEKQLEYAAPNYLLKEKIKLYEYEWREINITDILKQKLRRRIKDKDSLKIVFDIIDSNLKGLYIGSMTSQILAIFYLNDLDHFIKETLRRMQTIYLRVVMKLVSGCLILIILKF